MEPQAAKKQVPALCPRAPGGFCQDPHRMTSHGLARRSYSSAAAQPHLELDALIAQG